MKRAFAKAVFGFALAAVASTFAGGTNGMHRAIRLRDAGDGNIELSLSTTPGRAYVIEASSDLRIWVELFRATAVAGELVYLDPKAPALEKRFLRAIEFGAPPNDAFETRIQLGNSTTVNATGFNFNATRQDSEPSHAAVHPGDHSVWWSWTAPTDGWALVSANGSLFDTVIAVYSGDELHELTRVAHKIDCSKVISFAAEAGTTYHIAVTGAHSTVGVVRLAISLEAMNALAPGQLGEATIVLDDPTQLEPGLRAFSLVASEMHWSEQEFDGIGERRGGRIRAYAPADRFAALTLDGESGEEILVSFEFASRSAGRYAYSVDGKLKHKGAFFNFSNRKSRAPDNLVGNRLRLTRTFTTTGTSGQTHFYSFDHNGRFHDSDNEEHGTGSFVYSAEGDAASLKLTYDGPADFVDDKHQLVMTFTSATEGTFTSEYVRNDETRIAINGTLVLEYHR